MRMTIMTAAILIVAASSTAAGGSGAPPAPSTQSATAALDPCVLLTKQDAAVAVGEAIGEPKPINPGRSSMPDMTVAACEYRSAAGHSVQLTVWRFSGATAAMSLQIYKSECMKKEQLPGVGDLACWYNKDHRELQVLKGATLLTYEINRGGNATEALTTVAKKALARLP